MVKSVLLFVLIGVFSLNGFTQEEAVEQEKKNLITVAFGYTYIPNGAALDAHEADGVFIPSIGLDYFRRINPHWEIGIMADFEFGEYIVFDKNLNRENAILFAAMANYNLTKHFSFLAGGGMELERHKNLAIIRVGSEYVFRLKKEWLITPGFFYDFKEGFDTWALSVGIGKEF